MVLLIVDDEELTRGGLLKAIDWEKIGITQVETADDGQNGYHLAEKIHPDIILCDVRMPRMNGIEMIIEIRKKDPDVVAVFMSGFSDKEYLKSAIYLQAVDYIEKPIDAKEMTDTMIRAVEQVEQKRASRYQLSSEDRDLRKLANLLTMPYEVNRYHIERLLKERNFPDNFKDSYVFSCIVKMKQPLEDSYAQLMAEKELSDYLKQMHIQMVCTDKKAVHMIFHFFCEREPQESSIRMIVNKIHSIFKGMGEFYISVGTLEQHVANTYRSYENAVVYLQEYFFHEPGSILTEASLLEIIPADVQNIEQGQKEFEHALSEQQKKECMEILQKFYSYFSESKKLLPNQVKGTYYDMFRTLYQVRKNKQLTLDMSLQEQENIMDIMEQCFSYRQMHETLVGKVEQYFEDMEDLVLENPVVTMIIQYISDNYSDSSLSVKSISAYANLSASYVCTLFKHETGSTLNQFITDYRMKKAKLLLADPRIRISDISARVGYNDGNYFAKTFRKATDLSPSEFREQVNKSEQY